MEPVGLSEETFAAVTCDGVAESAAGYTSNFTFPGRIWVRNVPQIGICTSQADTLLE